MTVLAIATFETEGAFVRARLRAITTERRIVGQWMPYASETLGEGAGQRGIMGGVVIGGVLGSLGLFALESWSAGIAYPINSGARALWSWQAFLPSAVEVSALAGAIVGIVLLFRNAGLTRLHHPAFDVAEVARAAQDRFVLAIACDAGEDANAVLALMVEAGADHSRLEQP